MSRWVDWAHPVPLRKWMFQLSRSSRSQSAHWNDSALLEQASKALCGEKSLKDQIGTIGTQEGGVICGVYVEWEMILEPRSREPSHSPGQWLLWLCGAKG